MGAAEGVKSRVSLFRATALQLNALQQNALYARQKNEGTGRAYRAIMVVRCFVNNVFSARYPSSNGLQTGYDHFVAIIHRRWTFMRAGARPLYDFFRVACTRASPCFTRFEKCFIAPIFLALSISLAINEKRSSCFFLLFYVTVSFFWFWVLLVIFSELSRFHRFIHKVGGGEVGVAFWVVWVFYLKVKKDNLDGYVL